MKTLEAELEELNDENNNLRDIISNKDEELTIKGNHIADLEEQLESNDLSTDNDEDCRRSLFFTIKELEEVQQGTVTLADKLFDLQMRYCRFL